MKKILMIAIMAMAVNNVQAQGFLGKVLKGLEKANEVLDKAAGNKGTTSTSTSNAATKQDAASFTTQEMGDAVLKIETLHPDLKVKVTRSVVADKTAYIDLEFRSMAVEDVSVFVTSSLDAESAGAIDNNGVELGKESITFVAQNARRYNVLKFDLVEGVKKKVSVQIEGISKVAESLARLRFEIKCDGGISMSRKVLTIRNIPLNRDDAE